MAEQTKDEYEQNVNILANLESIRVNQFEPFNIFTENLTGAIDATSQMLEFPVFEPGWIYVITSITAYVLGDDDGQIKIGIRDGVTRCVYQSATVAQTGDSVEYVGQLMCKESDKIYVEFRSFDVTATLYASMNGYRIRR